MQAELRIGEVAERTGTTTSAIRFYEDEGLLTPAPRTGAGYRLYDDEAVARLRFIHRAKAVGLRLSEIREILSSPDAASERQMLRHRVAHRLTGIRDQQRELQALEAALSGLYLKLLRDDCDCRHLGNCQCQPLNPTTEEVQTMTNETATIEHSTCTCGCGTSAATRSTATRSTKVASPVGAGDDDCGCGCDCCTPAERPEPAPVPEKQAELASACSCGCN